MRESVHSRDDDKTSLGVFYTPLKWMNITLPGNISGQLDQEITRSIRNRTLQALCKVDKKNDLKMLTDGEKATLYKQIIVDDDRRFLFCFIPKVACSNWKRVIKVMQGTLDPQTGGKMDHHSGITLLQDDEINLARFKVRKYYKFMFVRHPLERLLSAYRNKFGENIGDYRRRYGAKIIKAYRTKSQAKEALMKNDLSITFEEFLRFLVDSNTAKMDVHWKPMHELCQPCAVHYDFVGSFEQLREDADYVLDKIRGNSTVTFPMRQNYYKPTTPDTLISELSKVRPLILQQLVDKYILDFALFGYAAPSIDVGS